MIYFYLLKDRMLIIRVLVILSLYFHTTVSINQNEGNELLGKAALKYCNTKTSDVPRDCMKKIAKGFFSVMGICQRESYKSCELCTSQDDFIENVLLIKAAESINLAKFVDIGMKLGLQNSNSSIACKSNATANAAFYTSVLQDHRSRNSENVNFIKMINSNINSKVMDSSFTKCISYKELIEEADLSKDTDTASKEIIAFKVLHHLNGFLASSDCSTELPYPLVITELYKFMGLSAPTDNIAESNLEKLVKALKLGNPTNSSGTHTDGDGHDHSRHKRSVNILNRVKRAVASKKINCFTVDQLYNVAGLDHEAGMTFNQFQTMAPLLIQQLATNSCIVNSTNNAASVSNAEKYGYGTLAVFIICLCSLFGVLVVPMHKQHKCYSFTIAFLIGMGIGTLVGDAILHLIPQTIGMHSHNPKEIGMLCGILITILAMIILESIFTLRSSSNSVVVEMSNEKPKLSEIKDDIEDLKESQESLAPKSAAYMVIIGDTIHNFADGLAIGAAFTISLSQGLAISIAAFCHELPHEFGDFAILLSTGMQWKWALLVNFLSSLSSLVGLYVGIAVSSNFALAQNIILTIAAGIFLYVALSDMMPHLQEIIRVEGLSKMLIGIFGIMFGFIILGLLAFFEENIKQIKA